MPNGEQAQLIRKLIERKLVTPDEIELVLGQQRDLMDKGKRIHLAELLVQEGYVTKSQIKRLDQAMEDDSMFRPAQQIPGYQILGKLGHGAMATVFKAKQLSLDRLVAIKVLPKRLSENPEFVDRFYREGRAAARLNHPHIVQAIDVGQSSGYHYFVMEYVEGQTVYDGIKDGKPYTEKRALDILLQSTRALEHAHARGFIHRDVKPKNIMLTRDGLVKLADMGLAREVTDYEAANAEAGRAYGTPYYISPEQIRGEINIDFRADIYSLGATFYHMVTGKVPFDGASPTAVMHKHLKEPLVPPDHINKELSAGIGELVEVLMAKKRDERYASTADLIIDIEAVMQGEPPFQARKKYDRDVLQSLATGGENIEGPSADDLNPQPPKRDWGVILIMGIFLVLSLMINLAQWLMKN
jgi:serine/threonine-protein kinase